MVSHYLNPAVQLSRSLAIEARQEDEEVKEIFFTNTEIFKSVEIERTILKSHGGAVIKIGVSHEILETTELLTVRGETGRGRFV